jgi:hypothetical protein
MALVNTTDQPVVRKENANVIAGSQKAVTPAITAATTTPKMITTPPSPSSPLQIISQAIAEIISKEKLQNRPKEMLEGVLTYIKEIEDEAQSKVDGHAEHNELSTMRKSIKADLTSIHNVFQKQLSSILDSIKQILDVSGKVLAEVGAIKDTSKELDSKISKITTTANQIASTMEMYWEAVLKNPAQSNKNQTDPKVLGDMDRKVKQVLLDIYDTEGNDTLAKSLSELKDRANKTLKAITDSEKPDVVKVEMVTKTQGKALLLMFNSKEAAAWVKDLGNEHTFTKGFSEGAHIRERNFNLVVPQVPITFNPVDKEQLREVEEANGLQKFTITKARWIKPEDCRRSGQTNTYAIISTSSTETANLLIRDGLKIIRMKVRPSKQKQEPSQCMKCRRWGHFASECLAGSDTCGTCGQEHCTSSCQSREKLYCVSCKANTHASWDRACPEFTRRCAIMDGRNPENEMPFFPTEQDWTLVIKPNRIPLDERFPQRFAVNRLPNTGNSKSIEVSCNTNPSKDGYSRELHRRWKKASDLTTQHSNPNLIPIPPSRARVVVDSPSDNELEYLIDGEVTNKANIRMDETHNNLPTWI